MLLFPLPAGWKFGSGGWWRASLEIYSRLVNSRVWLVQGSHGEDAGLLWQNDNRQPANLCTGHKGQQSAPAGSGAWRMARRGMQTSMKIGVQPTAVACRKTPLRGRRARITGRPTKSSRREHNEGQRAIHCPKGRHHIVYPSVSLIVLHLAKITIKYRQEFFRLHTCPSNCIECSLIHLFFIIIVLV